MSARACASRSRHSADRVRIAVLEQPIELASVALKFGAFVEDLSERLLHRYDVLAYAEFAAQLLLNAGGADR